MCLGVRDGGDGDVEFLVRDDGDALADPVQFEVRLTACH